MMKLKNKKAFKSMKSSIIANEIFIICRIFKSPFSMQKQSQDSGYTRPGDEGAAQADLVI